MKLLRPIKTYRNYKRWKNIIKFNQDELKSKGFLVNWLSQLGLIISLEEKDIGDLKYIYDPFQYEVATREFTNTTMRNELKKHNNFFLDQGLLELINDDFRIEKSPIIDFTSYVTLSFRFEYFNPFMSWALLILAIGGIATLFII